MKIIVCVDENKGMMFNGRRQSRDRLVVENMLELTEGSRLYINDYSAELFKNADVTVDNGFLDNCGENDYCFVENLDVCPYLSKINTIVVYHWNRNYPFDFTLMVDLTKWKLERTWEFMGSSHEKITGEVYVIENRKNGI